MKPATHPTALCIQQLLAAGTPFAVFPLTPAELAGLTGAAWSDIRREAAK
jgi:hypothetical protein